MQNTAEDHDRVTIAFTGTLDNGAIFIEVPPEKPMTVTLGDSEMVPTVEMTIVGMSIGETKKVRVSPDEGFGPRLKSLLHEVPRDAFQDRFEPKPGMLISQKVEREGVEHTVPATIIDVNEQTVVIDYNHPLAGHHLTYELSLLAIEKAS